VASWRRWRRPERFYDLLAPLARLVVWLLADLRVVGAERVPARGGVLLAANHVSFLDPLVLALALYDCGRRKVRFLALADLFHQPLLGWLLRGTRMIPVARGRRAARMAEDACAALDAGQAVLVYPEGTIMPPGQTRPARHRPGCLARRRAGTADRLARPAAPPAPPATAPPSGERGDRPSRGFVALAWPAGPATPAGGKCRAAGQRAGSTAQPAGWLTAGPSGDCRQVPRCSRRRGRTSRAVVCIAPRTRSGSLP
jgi:1-acyl-sn-glycerol-3-phosphate acyltransferase